MVKLHDGIGTRNTCRLKNSALSKTKEDLKLRFPNSVPIKIYAIVRHIVYDFGPDFFHFS